MQRTRAGIVRQCRGESSDGRRVPVEGLPAASRQKPMRPTTQVPRQTRAVMVVRGTKRFLDRVGRPEGSEAQSSSALGDWYANVWFWRPQVALFVSERTLVPVIVPLAPASSVITRFPTSFAEIATRMGVDQSQLMA